jgi:hypothetical protein
MYSQISGAMICWSQRTEAEMTMASTHVPTLHEARAERIYARARFDDAVPVTISGNLAQDEARAKLPIASARSPFDLHVSHFSLFRNRRRPEFLLRLKMFKPTDNQRC